jgi:hypothetical protein
MELSERLGKLLRETGLKYKDVSAVTGIEMNRLKNIGSGNIKTLRPEEAQQLQTHYGYRATWLINGKGPDKLTADEKKMQPALSALTSTRSELIGLDLSDARLRFVSELLLGVRTQNAQLINDILDAGFAGKAQAAGSTAAVLSAFEQAFIDRLRSLPQWHQRAFNRYLHDVVTDSQY